MEIYKYLVYALVVLGVCYASERGKRSVKWSYSGKTGPYSWPLMYPTCGHYQQSPIHITHPRSKDFGPLKFHGYNKAAGTWTIENNGHAVTIKVPDHQMTISRGGLPHTYIVDSFHFHYGSEHVSDHRRFPMELHIVHYSNKYSSLKAAAASKDRSALAVIGVFIEVGDRNPAVADIVKKMTKIKYPGQKSNLRSFELRDLLPRHTSSFFRYHGSLTTPPCSEVVQWTLMTDPLYISWSQFREFAKPLFTKAGVKPAMPMIDNYRPVQPLYGRHVYCNTEHDDDDDNY